MRPVINNLDYTTRDYEGFRALMLSKLQELMPEYTDLRQSDAGVVILELNAMCLDILSYYLDSFANECFLSTAVQRSSILKYCYMLGYTPRYATAARYKQIFVKNDPSAPLTIPAGTKVSTYNTVQNKVVYFTTVDDLTIPAGAAGDETDASGNYLYSVEVLHGVLVNNEELVRLSGNTPNQAYTLHYAPALMDDTLVVYVNNTIVGSEAWTRVSSFAGSDSSSKVYTFEVNDNNETVIRFGNGSFGMIPANSQILCTYYAGGGSSGNVGVGSIIKMADNIAAVKSTTNVMQTVIGVDRETVDEIRVNAPLAHRNIWGALTVKDFAGATKTYFPSVVDSAAQKASNDWSSPAVDDINIYILTQNEVAYESPDSFFTPIPDSFYSDPSYTQITNSISAFFNSDSDYVNVENATYDTGRKLAGTRNIIVKKPYYTGINLAYTLIAKPYFDATEVSNLVTAYLKKYFSLGNLQFGDSISLVELSHDIIENGGFDGVKYLSFDIVGDHDDQGEIHSNYYDYENRDLIIPRVGVIITLTGVTPTIRSSSTEGGGINAG